MRAWIGFRGKLLCQLGSIMIVASSFGACGGRTAQLGDGDGDPIGDGDGDPTGDGDGDSSTGGAAGTGGGSPGGGAWGVGGGPVGGTGGMIGDECTAPLTTGPCLAAFTRYGFDPSIGQCREFVYGGCGGNANNYESMAECNAACGPREPCLLPPEVGDCDAAFPRFYYDVETGRCTQFVYGGCGGNENNFETLEECYDTCLNGGPGPEQQCTMAAECKLAFKGCCGPCQDAKPEDFWAFNSKYAGDGPWAEQPCDGVLCGACESAQAPLVGVACEDGKCVAFDARRFAECGEDADCTVRCGTSCCGDESPIALSDISGLEDLVCAPEMSCRACTSPPSAPAAFCDDGVCRVEEE